MRHERVRRAGFSSGVILLDLEMAIFCLCATWTSLCAFLCPPLLFQGHQAYWIRTHPDELTEP